MSVSVSFCVNTAAASPRCFVKPSPSSDVPAHGRYFRWRDRAVDIICFKLSPSLLFKQGTWPAHKGQVESYKEKPKPNHVAGERSTIKPSAGDSAVTPAPLFQERPLRLSLSVRTSIGTPLSSHSQESSDAFAKRSVSRFDFRHSWAECALDPATDAWLSLPLCHSGPSQPPGGSPSQKSATSHAAVAAG